MRKTKIICTLGPVTDNPDTLRALMLGGMNTVRTIDGSRGQVYSGVANIK